MSYRCGRKIKNALNEQLRDKWGKRGLEVYSMNIGVPSIPEEQRKKITEWEENAMTINPMTAGARLVGAQADAMRTAAGNEGGAMAGFLGMGMAMNAGSNAANLYAMGGNQTAPQTPEAPVAPEKPADSWTCACGAVNTGKFCSECGAKKPEEAATWTCACGSVNTGKFCPECGAKKPEEKPSYRCSVCKWEPEDPKNPPKFCPQCGHKFGEEDII